MHATREIPAIVTAKQEDALEDPTQDPTKRAAQQQLDAEMPTALKGGESRELINQHVIDSLSDPADEFNKSIREALLAIKLRFKQESIVEIFQESPQAHSFRKGLPTRSQLRTLHVHPVIF